MVSIIMLTIMFSPFLLGLTMFLIVSKVRGYDIE